MGKGSNPSRTADNEARAFVKFLRVSPQKLNLVAGQIRGQRVEHALNVLEFSSKRIAQDVRKALSAAIANAENNHQLDVDRLVVGEASVGKQMMLKRIHARARGRAARIQKPFSNLTIIVREVEDAEEAS
jgi:large subunit ribosomal protein L22